MLSTTTVRAPSETIQCRLAPPAPPACASTVIAAPSSARTTSSTEPKLAATQQGNSETVTLAAPSCGSSA